MLLNWPVGKKAQRRITVKREKALRYHAIILTMAAWSAFSPCCTLSCRNLPPP
ncbi:hypothetical protein KCP78_24855 [Salmonella enterica subsp. enterica]|nr:hypothetical protein KCP78_24855 [Salmonella enterica subsp. enterica]